MSKTMDVVFVDCTSSMTSYFNQIYAAITFISAMMLSTQSGVRIGLLKCRSMYGAWNTRVYEFTEDINTLQQWLNNDEPNGISSNGYEAVGDALHEGLRIGWRANVDEQVSYKKLVILFTDSAPNGIFTPLVGADPWIMSNRYLDQNITLVVVGAGESVIECDDFYCALAENTGGEYIPMVNFKRIFTVVVNSVLNEEGDTVSQALRRINIEEIEQNSSFKYTAMRSRVNGMINECQSMAGIRELFFNHRSSHI